MNFNLNDFGFKWDKLHYFDFGIDNSFDALIQLNKNHEESLLRSKDEIDKKIETIKELNKELGEEGIHSYIHHLYYEDDMVINELQKVQRYSMVLSIFAFYENQLKSICNMIEADFDFDVKIEKLSRKKGDLMKYWTYLSKIYKVDIQILKPLFIPLNNEKKIRNIIAHQGGIISEKEAEKIQLSVGLVLNKVGEYYVLEIDNYNYINYLLKSLKDFFKVLLREVDKKYRELKA